MVEFLLTFGKIATGAIIGSGLTYLVCVDSIDDLRKQIALKDLKIAYLKEVLNRVK